ncbi:hypothetical protein PANT111_40208 [Pantoea brenneri]|uniref:Uncharacterized protein n=1 Tax=Pantoea brenneri TaxID=472694 RepID=A0AAX3JAR5_9GAMM|nr:hypothetical protein PANT111_40208 [Pantoea brenneri]
MSMRGCTYAFDFREGQGIQLNKFIQLVKDLNAGPLRMLFSGSC